MPHKSTVVATNSALRAESTSQFLGSGRATDHEAHLKDLAEDTHYSPEVPPNLTHFPPISWPQLLYCLTQRNPINKPAQ